MRLMDEAGLLGKMVPEFGELSGTIVARIIANRFLEEEEETCLVSAIARLNAKTDASNLPTAPPERSHWFCAGCPHNSSTKLPKGSRALAGIGLCCAADCHLFCSVFLSFFRKIC